MRVLCVLPWQVLLSAGADITLSNKAGESLCT